MYKYDKNTKFGVCVFFTINLILFTIPTAFATEEKSNAELDAFKVISQLRLENARDLLKKDIQTLSVRVDAQDKRIDSQNSHIDQSLSLLSIVLGVLGIVFAVGSFVGYFSVRSRALKQAEASAEEWFNKNAANIQSEIESLRDKLKELERAADTNFINHKEKMKEKETLADKAVGDLQKLISSSPNVEGEKSTDGNSSRAQPLSDKISEALAQVAMATKDKPESKFDFNDYNFRAFDSFRNGDIESAIQFWRAAAYHHTATSDASYQALLNVGRALDLLARHDEAISVFDDILERNSQQNSENSKAIEIQALNGKALSLAAKNEYDLSLEVYNLILDKISRAGSSLSKELIVESLGNRAVALERKGECEEPLKIYDGILKEYSGKGSDDLHQMLLNITVSALRTLARLRRYEEFDARFEKMVSEFGEKKTTRTKRYISLALNSKGFSLLCLAKEGWLDEESRNTTLANARTLFEEGVELNPTNPNIFGNLAYCKHLLGLPESDLKWQLGRAVELGGKNLYEDTLGDLDIFPVSEVDEAFRRILDDVMSAYQSKEGRGVS
ncbi:tetratricopeptide repeat protein [Pseudomonas sp. PSE1(2024)]|uniref:tetratricopeptide repeat protein n=1 Tax=Pseudomonas sp. PSE1(2024) TaxID=3228746 RepID=UPI003D95A4B7